MTKEKKRLLILILFSACIMLSFCLGFAVCRFSPEVDELMRWQDETRAAIYGGLDQSREALDDFLTSGDPEALSRSSQAIRDILVRVELCGDHCGFLAQDDNVGPLVLGACADFLESAASYMEDLDPENLSQTEWQTLLELLDTLTDKDGGPTQFKTIYFQLLPNFPNGVLS